MHGKKMKAHQMDAMRKILSTPGGPIPKKGDGVPVPEGTRSVGEADRKNKGPMFNAFVRSIK